MEVHVHASSVHVPGDIRTLGTGDELILYRTAPKRKDWTALLCAMPNAIARGASVRWLK